MMSHEDMMGVIATEAAEAAAGSQQRSVPPHEPATSEDAKRKIVDLWLSGETNEARLILEAFKIGLDEGRRVRGNTPDQRPGATKV